MKIFTIGYGGRSIQELIRILKANKIQKVIDVRRFPTSKYEVFRSENLCVLLDREDISYLHLKELGGYRRPSYQEFTKSEEFLQGINRLLQEAKDQNVALLCLEKSFTACHRRFIAEAVEERKVEVVHL
jgi:uncharacterized protein (DUF488 family)